MKIVDPGHRYELAGGNRLVFLRKGDGKIVQDGTTNEELLTVLIDRVTGAFQNLPCQESIRALYLLREALAAFQMRAARRVDANVEGTLRPHDHITHPVDVALPRMMSMGVDEIDYAPN
jgi:hypothetical protein